MKSSELRPRHVMLSAKAIGILGRAGVEDVDVAGGVVEAVKVDVVEEGGDLTLLQMRKKRMWNRQLVRNVREL